MISWCLINNFCAKMKRFSSIDKPKQNKTPPPTPHPQRNRKPIKSTIKKHDSICNVYDIYTGVSLPPHSQRACWAVSLYWLYIGSCTVLTHEIMFIHVQHPLAAPLPSPSYTHTHTPAALSATNSRRGLVCIHSHLVQTSVLGNYATNTR